MKRLLAITLAAIFALTLLSGCSKDSKSSWQMKIDKNATGNKYTLLFIDNGSSADTADLKSNMKELSEKMSDQFVLVEVNYTKNEAEILKYLNTSGIAEFPLALSIAPSGLICGGFTKQCTEAELKETIVSGKEEDIMLSMQKGLISLLCIYNGESEKFIDVKKSLDSIETNYNGVIVAHYLDATKDTDKEFISKLPEVTGNITVMITVPPGNILAMLKDDEITLTSLLSTIQSTCSSGSCGTGGCG